MTTTATATRTKWHAEKEPFSWLFTAPCGAEYRAPFTGGLWLGRDWSRQSLGTGQFCAGPDRRTALRRMKRLHDCNELACGEEAYADTNWWMLGAS